MKAAKKIKMPAATLPVPQNRNEAATAIARIGELSRDLARREANMNDALARIKEKVEETAEPLRQEIKALTDGLKAWSEANRAALTNGGKTKTVDLGTGTVSWRARPASVTLRGKVDEIVARLKTAGLTKFIRTKEEPNKEAMLGDPALARTIAGIGIASAGEDFVVEPFEGELREGVGP